MKKGYHFLDDLTSDVMFEAYGQSLEEVLIYSALGMFSVICDIKEVKPLTSLSITVSAQTEKELLYDFLSTLLTESEIKGLFICKCSVSIKKQNNRFQLTTEARGESMSREKGGTVVKGITYYGLSLEKTEKGYRAQVAMDI